MWFKSVYTHIKRKRCVFQTSHFNTDIIANLLPENRLAERGGKRATRWSNRNNALAFMNYISAFILSRIEDFLSLCIYPRQEWINHDGGVIPFYMHWEPYRDNTVHIKHLLWLIWNASDAKNSPRFSYVNGNVPRRAAVSGHLFVTEDGRGEYWRTGLFLMTPEFWLDFWA